ncbi:MAG: hypothetical protein E7218_04155 [Anaerofustis stercorihominis]|nr:hypothetical protein [Anaerofustis stercorihominis]
MKKIISLLLAAMMIFSFAACGSDENTTTDIKDATELLTNVWATYADDEKFPAAGGDYNNSVMDGPGAFDVSDAEALDAMLGCPVSATEITDAASLMHMMNQNTFTAGAYHIAVAADAEKLCDALKENIMNRQWMCGFPDTLIVATVGDEYVVSAFGNAELIENFKTKLTAKYTSAEVVYEESLAF